MVVLSAMEKNKAGKRGVERSGRDEPVCSFKPQFWEKLH